MLAKRPDPGKRSSAFKCQPSLSLVRIIAATSVLFCLLLVSGCGGSGSDGNPSGVSVLPGDDQVNPEGDGDSAGSDSSTGPLPDAANCAESFDSVEITIPTTLSNTDSVCDYYFRGTTRIMAPLTIEPGTLILMGQDAWVVVDNGSIDAVGDVNQRIVIRGERSIIGFWQGIRLNNARPSRIEHVDIMDAGNFANTVSSAQPGALTAVSGTLSLVDTSISNSNRDGAVLSSQLGNVRLTAFSGNRFFANFGKPLVISGNLLEMLDEATDYRGEVSENGDPVVEVQYTATTGDRYTVKAINVPYRPTNAISAGPGQLVTLESGVRMELGVSFGRFAGARSGGRYVAVGTPDEPIVFTHSSSPEAQNAGSTVEASDEGVVILQHVQLQGVSVVAGRDGTLQINDAQITDSPGYAIECSPLANPVEGNTNLSFSGNALGEYSPDCLF